MGSQSRIVAVGYNALAGLYDEYRSGLAGTKYVQKLHERLRPQSTILDVGCGTGLVVDEYLIKKGHLVTGLDISDKQISLARKRLPSGNFMVRDMLSLKPQEFAVDAVVSFYALFHVPREHHQNMLSTFASYLPVDGWLLLTMGDRDFEGMHELLGEPMWSSHFGPTANRRMVEKAGFEIVLDEMDGSGGEKHQVILAQKL